MNFRASLMLLGVLLSSCGDDSSNGSTSRPPSNPTHRVWEIGPVIGTRNYSVNMPLRATREGQRCYFDFGVGKEPHYVTFRHGSLSGKQRIRMKFQVDGASDTVIHGAGCDVRSPSGVVLYFQRRDDSWNKDGWRWWATPVKQRLTAPGSYEIVAPLNGEWTSVMSMKASTSPTAFSQAKAETDRVGFTFSNCDGQGHGATATDTVRFRILEYVVE